MMRTNVFQLLEHGVVQKVGLELSQHPSHPKPYPLHMHRKSGSVTQAELARCVAAVRG